MKTIILAGGLGIRLRPLTETIPKPMVLLNNKPYLEYQIAYLKQFGFTDIVLMVGYLGEKIESYFGDGSRMGVSIVYSYEKTLLGTAGALKNAEDLISTDQFLLLYGDSFLPIDLNQFVESFLESRKKCLLAVYDNKENTHVKNNIRLDEDKNICAYEKDAVGENFYYVDSGVLCLKKDVLGFIPKGAVASLETDVFPKLIKDRAMAAYMTNTRFFDIGTPERLKVAEVFFAAWKLSL